MELFGMSLITLLKVIGVDIVLSGDNAVLIAMAAKNLPEEHRKKAVLIGTAGAIGLRLLFAAIIVWLIKIPYITAIGGLLLIQIAYKLLVSKEHTHKDGGNTVWSAVKTIIIADAVMSLDNVLALVGVAHGFMPIMIGVLISIPIIIFGSQLILKAMERFPAIIYAGAALLAYTAGEMLTSDKKIHGLLMDSSIAGSMNLIEKILPIAIAVGIVGIGYIKRRKNNKSNELQNQAA